MIDFKEELSKFKQIQLENDENEPIVTDKDSLEAVNCYNKALEQFEGGLDDMARANLRRAITLRHDFSYAISLLSLHLLSKGDRLGVVKLTSGIQDEQVRAEVMPYIDYLFTKYDKVEAVKEKKTGLSDFTETELKRPSVYTNDNGRTQERRNDPPFERSRKKPFEEKTSNDLAALFDNNRDSSKDARRDNADRYAKDDRKAVKEPDDSEDEYYGAYGKNVFKTSSGASQLYSKEEKEGRKNFFGESTDKTSVRSPERQKRSDDSDTRMKTYTKEEIKRHRILGLAAAAVLVLIIVLLIIITDLASQNRELRKRLEETYLPGSRTVAVDMSEDIL